MQKITTFFSRIQIYPLLFSIYPLWFLYNHNIKYVHITTAYRSLAITVALTVAMVVVLNLLIKNEHKAALVTQVILILFFTYGHVSIALDNKWPGLVHNLYLTGLWFLLLVVLVWVILKNQIPASYSKFFTIVTVVALGISLYQTASFEIGRMIANRNISQPTVNMATDIPIEELPDVYYIILDAHARQDVLDRQFDYDVSGFVSGLEELGFYVPTCSQTNYWPTEFSLTSTFNIDYLPNFLEDLDILPEVLPDWGNSLVKQTFDSYNYTSIVFETRATHNRNFGEDILLSRRDKVFIYENIYPFTNLNDFEAQLIKTTWMQAWLLLLANQKSRLPDEIVLDVDTAAYLEHYRQTLFVLDELPRVPYLEEDPKFVFVHLLVPHEPFIFNPDGRFEHRHSFDEFVVGYRNNTEFIDLQILLVVEQIIQRSSKPPIIIIQGDHGPNSVEPETTMPIFNAYYLPKGYQQVYDTITPVNTFRIVFNEYLGLDYDLLEDESYFSPTKLLSEYELVPNICP